MVRQRTGGESDKIPDELEFLADALGRTRSARSVAPHP
jgi:hypothetical protein